MSERATRHLAIHGRVQGVGYRVAMAERARELGVCGWARNRRDGSVEAMIHGTPEALEALAAWARQGPPGARVTDVRVQAAEGEFRDFEIRGTA